MLPDIHPDYLPENPPGYIFVTNSSYLDALTKLPNTVLELQTRLSKSLNIPIQDFLTLEKICKADFSTFVTIQHKDKVDSWRKGVVQMIEFLLKTSEAEES